MMSKSLKGKSTAVFSFVEALSESVHLKAWRLSECKDNGGLH